MKIKIDDYKISPDNNYVIEKFTYTMENNMNDVKQQSELEEELFYQEIEKELEEILVFQRKWALIKLGATFILGGIFVCYITYLLTLIPKFVCAFFNATC